MQRFHSWVTSQLISDKYIIYHVSCVTFHFTYTSHILLYSLTMYQWGCLMVVFTSQRTPDQAFLYVCVLIDLSFCLSVCMYSRFVCKHGKLPNTYTHKADFQVGITIVTHQETSSSSSSN